MSSKKDKKKSNKEINIEFELFENHPDEWILINNVDDIKITNLAFSDIDFSNYTGFQVFGSMGKVQNQYFKKPELLPAYGFPTRFELEEVQFLEEKDGFRCEPVEQIRRVKDGFVLTDYNHIRLFMSFLSYVLREIRQNFSKSVKNVLNLEAEEEDVEWRGKKWKTAAVNEKDIQNLAKFITDNYDNFFNNVEEFRKNFNKILMNNSIEMTDYNIEHERLDDNFYCPLACYQIKLTIKLND